MPRADGHLRGVGAHEEGPSRLAGVRLAAQRFWHGGTQIPAAPAPRVAAAPRQLQTRWLVAVVAVVLLGGVLLLYAVPLYAGRSPVLVLARDVKAGASLPPRM